MDNKLYKEHLISTIINNTEKVKSYIKETFIKEDIIYEMDGGLDQTSILDIESSAINVTGLHLSEQLKAGFDHVNAIRVYETWEFIKDYKYSVLFESEEFENLKNRIKKNIDENPNKTESENFSDSLSTPSYYEDDGIEMFKFTKSYSGYDTQTREERLLKFPILLVFHNELNIIEMRFDALRRIFISNTKYATMYSDLVGDLMNNISNEYQIDLKPIDLTFMINVGKNVDDVILTAQYMRLAQGGTARLEVGSNEEYLLPFLGELKALMEDNAKDLELVPTVREALESYIFEKEEMSDYPWIELLWKAEVKTRNKQIKIIFNYSKNDYSLIQHYSSSVFKGMERMNFVAKYISLHREDS